MYKHTHTHVFLPKQEEYTYSSITVFISVTDDMAFKTLYTYIILPLPVIFPLTSGSTEANYCYLPGGVTQI